MRDPAIISLYRFPAPVKLPPPFYALGGLMSTITGAMSDDTLVGTSDADTIKGLGGDDLLISGGGADSIDGGDGDDHVVANGFGGTMKGGAGRDILEVDAFAGGAVIDVSAITSPDAVAVVSLNGAAVKVSGFELTYLIGWTGNDTITGSALGDFVSAGQGNDRVDAGLGDDYVKSSVGDDTLAGGAGFDRIGFFSDAPNGAHVDLRLQGAVQDTGAGLDLLTGFENVSGTNHNDVLIGDGGENILWGSSGGDDILSGNAGNDALEVGDGNHTLNGGDGVDTLSVWGNSTDTSANVHIDLNLQGSAAQDTGVGMMVIKNIENLSGSIHDDLLTGDRFANLLAGVGGADTLLGGASADRLYGDGYQGSDYEFGLSGPISTSEAEYVNVTPGADSLDGGKGDDILVGGGAGDSLTGGGGADTFRFVDLRDSSVETPDFITDFNQTADFLDVSAIDANSLLEGDQAFTLVNAFTHTAGEAQLVYDRTTGITTISLDVDGDGDAEAAIHMGGRFTVAGMGDGTFVA